MNYNISLQHTCIVTLYTSNPYPYTPYTPYPPTPYTSYPHTPYTSYNPTHIHPTHRYTPYPYTPPPHPATQVDHHREHMVYYMIFLRITPILPNWFINIVAPVIDVPIIPFFIGTFIGYPPTPTYSLPSFSTTVVRERLQK